MAKDKYWRNLNLVIGNSTYGVLHDGSPHVVRVQCEDRSRSHGPGEFQLESCVRSHHIYKSTWTLLLGEVLSAASQPHATLEFIIFFIFIFL